MKYIYLCLIISCSLILGLNSSCKKKLSFGTAALDFSTDTLVFDTVFTTIGTTTKHFKFYNKDSRPINVSKIELLGGANSPFRINVDGLTGTTFSDIEMDGKDSLYIFVEATLNVNGQNLPMIVEDKIRFTTNGKEQIVTLVVWGQDAYFHYSDLANDSLDLNEGIWPNDKPHVIYNYAFVDSAKTLTIQPNTKIYLHKNSMLQVYKGTLNIEGTLNNEVTIEGDRLESEYDDVSGQYYGIYFNKALPSSINYLKLKNATAGIHVYSEDPSNSGFTLELKNSIIQNCARYGVFIFDGGKVRAENCIISKNGFHSLLVLGGGDFEFNQCHLLGYASDNETPAVGISNYFIQNGVNTIAPITKGNLYNCVIYGNQNTEIVLDTLSGTTLNFDIRNCLIKKETAENNSVYSFNVFNQDPQFKDIAAYDFDWWSTSAMKDIGNVSLGNPNVIQDILGHSRSATPDVGAYEK